MCPECSAVGSEGDTCQDRFHQMLGWESEYGGELLEVHHLTVLCYHLQHPSLYSPEGLTAGVKLLVEFIEKGVSTTEIRRRNQARLNSRNRTWKIKGTPGSHGTYSHPIRWSITSADVTAAGPDRYPEAVHSWAQAVLADLKISQNILPRQR